MRVEDQKNALPGIPEIFGHAQRRFCRKPPHHRAFVAGGNNDDRLAEAVAQRIFDKFLHFAAALAYGGENGRVEPVPARQHRKQCRFADARARKDADALARAKRREDVDCAHACEDRFFDSFAMEGWWGRTVERNGVRATDKRRPAIGRPGHSVDDAALPGLVGTKLKRRGYLRPGADRSPVLLIERPDEDQVAVDANGFRSLAAETLFSIAIQSPSFVNFERPAIRTWLAVSSDTLPQMSIREPVLLASMQAASLSSEPGPSS